MGYVSVYYAVFIMVLLFLYYRKIFKKNQWVLLLLASIAFYAANSLKGVIYIGITIITSFFTGRFLEKSDLKSKRRRIMVLCIFVNVLILVGLKYGPWFINESNNILNLLGIKNTYKCKSVVVPLGISFYTLQMISYIVDVYKGKVQCEKNIAKYALYIMYFPNVIQGPICRFQQLGKQFLEHHDFSFEDLKRGLLLMGSGLIKKLVIADRIAIFNASMCVDGYFEAEGFILYAAMILYSFQLYFDFSGCFDMCRGVSELFGIKLPQNFQQPYFSKTIKEFWHRWHISLSSWLRDYIYIPLGGNRKGKIKQSLFIIITFGISGIWHGVGLNFFVWGFLHALYQIVGNVTITCRKQIKKMLGIKENSFSEKFYMTIINFHLVSFAWVFFNSENTYEALGYLKHMFVYNPWTIVDGSIYQYGLGRGDINIIVIGIFIFMIIEYGKYSERLVNIRDKVIEQHFLIQIVIYVGMVVAVALFGIYGPTFNPNSFIYGGF